MSAQGTGPRIWRVLGDKRGDNGQVEMIAEALKAARETRARALSSVSC